METIWERVGLVWPAVKPSLRRALPWLGDDEEVHACLLHETTIALWLRERRGALTAVTSLPGLVFKTALRVAFRTFRADPRHREVVDLDLLASRADGLGEVDAEDLLSELSLEERTCADLRVAGKSLRESSAETHRPLAACHRQLNQLRARLAPRFGVEPNGLRTGPARCTPVEKKPES